MLNHNDFFYIETYGCQMNVSDSEIVTSILTDNGFVLTKNIHDANFILINTCSIRDKAEQYVLNRLLYFNSLKKKKPYIHIIVLGCMAKRLKNKLIETKLVDVIAGPDSYRDLPNLIRLSLDGQKAINVILSREETYADITPVRLNSNRVSAFVTIMRGCNNMCTFCVVPFTRGRERSRNPKSIIEECISLYNNGYKEVTLIGQNVDSYLWLGKYVNKNNYHKVNFANLLGLIASLLPNMRIRFCTSNPHDMTEDVLLVMKNYSNICKHIHLPVQSGSNNILRKMNRKYSREQYVQLIDKIRYLIPSCSISHDIISGFCGETDQDHLDTLSLMEYVKYDFGYMFTYSPRPNTLAFRSFKDDVSNKLKKTRLTDIINMQQKHSYYRMSTYIGTIQEVLIEGVSKKSNIHLYGRNSQNAIVVFPNNNLKIGDVVKVRITKHTSATLIGEKIN